MLERGNRLLCSNEECGYTAAVSKEKTEYSEKINQ
jgi:hypothetical protein